MNTVWVVSYYREKDGEPTVTVFDNEDAAQRCYDCYKGIYPIIAIDEVPVYSKFIEFSEL